jgi:hypothetical protein
MLPMRLNSSGLMVSTRDVPSASGLPGQSPAMAVADPAIEATQDKAIAKWRI